MNRIYHSHLKWEEVEFNMYGSYNSKDKEQLIQKVINFFNNEDLTQEYMEKVTEMFVLSCEHNLTNPNMNRIAFIGQCALAIYDNIPRDITMIAWNFLNPKVQERANKQARKIIERWEKCQKNI